MIGHSSNKKLMAIRTPLRRQRSGLLMKLSLMVSHIGKPESGSNFFLAPEIERDEEKIPIKAPKSMSFFRKFAELQLLMLQHNAGLTASHPYASSPINWPFVISGISFWTENDSKSKSTSLETLLVGGHVLLPCLY